MTLPVQYFINLVSEHYKVMPENMILKCRKREYCLPRQVAMEMIHHNGNMSQSKTASYFGKDHATVVHACKVVSNLKDTDKTFRADYEKLMAKMYREDQRNRNGFTKNECLMLIGIEL